MSPAHNTRGETPSKNFAPDPLVSIQSTDNASLGPSAQLLSDARESDNEQEPIPNTFIHPGQTSPTNPPGKRARADTAGTPLLSEEDVKRRELVLRLRKAEKEEAEENLRARRERETAGFPLHGGAQGAGFQFQGVRKYPSIVIETANKFPGVDPKYILAIYKNKLDPMNLIKLREGGHDGSATSVEAYGSDISLWAYCFITYVAIYGRLFEHHLDVVRAMNDFARWVLELAMIHELRAVITFAASRMQFLNISPHNAELWAERDPNWEATFFSLATLKASRTPRTNRPGRP
ncbi:hypothetical protein CHU98_g9809 [Xylaria longipes]|nr:hypothetical protein CHU98_g9809 [Xylaria longipes]